MSYETKYNEALTRGTLLYNLIDDIKKFNSEHHINTILDLGGGNGSNIALLKKFVIKFSKCYVIDIRPHKIYDCAYLKLDLNKDKLPFDDGSVDVILLIEVIEHLVNPDLLLTEINRILSKKGICIITTPNLAWWPNIFLLAMGYQPIFTEVSTKKIYGRSGREVVGHLRIFTHRSLREMLLDYGFKIIKFKTVQTGIVPKCLRYIDALTSKINPKLGCDIYAMVKK